MKIIAKRVFFILAGFIILFSCTLQEPGIKTTTVNKQDSLYFSRLMFLGDDNVAGYQNLALTEKHQKYSFPAQIAKQGGTPDFQQPLMGYPGIGVLSPWGYGTIELYHLDNPETPDTRIPDPLIRAIPYEDYPDYDLNMPFTSEDVMTYPLPYSNLGVPGIVMEDILKGKTKLKSKSHTRMLDIILRNPLPEPYGELTSFQQAQLFHPSILVCWVGMNDVLNFAQYPEGDQPSIPEPTAGDYFAEKFAAMADSLKSLNVALLIGNVPDITDMPYFNTVPPIVIDSVTNMPYLDDNGNTVPLIGVEAGDKILTPAKGDIKRGYGIPEGILNGNGLPLPDDKILDVSEIALVRESVESYNASIDSICAKRKIPVVDIYTLYKELNTGLNEAGFIFTNTFISGGFFSLDGIHPSDLGNGILANEWIRAINSNFPVSIPPVNLFDLISELQPLVFDTTAVSKEY